ncbi:MAG: glycosyltransferase, partial [Actinobacteria bacterium]|nr:glycosyltransferase [Actinomycetota bacterium]
GRLAPQKDPRTLFHSVWSVMQADPSVWFVHVGHGELAEEMTAWAESTGMSERWVHVPYLESPERIYQLFDGFVVCPIFEAGWPLVLLEALAAGLPVVTTRSPGMSDIDRAGLSHCWTASPRDVEGVARGLRHLVAAVSADATTNHRAYAAEHFDPAARYADVRAVYLEIAPSTR